MPEQHEAGKGWWWRKHCVVCHQVWPCPTERDRRKKAKREAENG